MLSVKNIKLIVAVYFNTKTNLNYDSFWFNQLNNTNTEYTIKTKDYIKIKNNIGSFIHIKKYFDAYNYLIELQTQK